MQITIEWTRCRRYDEAKNYHQVVYLHEWNGRPFYWGVCDKTVFGGNKRKVKGVERIPRYATSYRHWIEGCLLHGGSLYVGKVLGRVRISLKEIEQALIAQHPPKMSQKGGNGLKPMTICHIGEVPKSTRGAVV